MNKQSTLFCQLVSYEENKVLWIRPRLTYRLKKEPKIFIFLLQIFFCKNLKLEICFLVRWRLVNTSFCRHDVSSTFASPFGGTLRFRWRRWGCQLWIACRWQAWSTSLPWLSTIRKKFLNLFLQKFLVKYQFHEKNNSRIFWENILLKIVFWNSNLKSYEKIILMRFVNTHPGANVIKHFCP